MTTASETNELESCNQPVLPEPASCRYRIGVVIVAFNSEAVLHAVLSAVTQQSRPPDEIIVVDNGSTDATGQIAQEFGEVRYVRLEENTGSAGGFHEGIRIAIENNDYVMTLDDDIELEPDALTLLERYIPHLSANGARLGAYRCWFKGRSADRIRTIVDFAWRGTIISKAAIDAVGLPKKEYFLYAEDVEYGRRLLKDGWDMFIVPEGLLIDLRKDVNKHKVNWMGEQKFYQDKFRLYYSFRNITHLHLQYSDWRKLGRLIGYGGKVMLFLLVGGRGRGLAHMRAVVDGFFDGFLSRLGKNHKYLPGG